jgi:hypothetical protein
MSIKDKAVEKIAAQLIALVGEENFIIITPTFAVGRYNPNANIKPKGTKKRIHDFRNAQFVQDIKALQAGESTTVKAIPGVPSARLQSATSAYALRFFGPKNTMTSRNPDGSVDVLRLT